MDILNETQDHKFEEDEVEEDDVPPDFFDDFSNKDFLAGLDVVDAWEDAEMPYNKSINGDQAIINREEAFVEDNKVIVTREDAFKNEGDEIKKECNEYDKESKKKNDFKRGRRKDVEDGEINDEKKKSIKERLGIRRRRTRSRSGSRNRRYRSRSRSRSNKHSNDESRRDPNKTKRDIQRDKLKCAKDKEAKIISEKLRVVETGLVPPGMEMDVDLNELQRQSKEKKEPVREEARRPKRVLSRSPSPLKARRKYRSPVRFASPKRRYSPNRRSPERRYTRNSPKYRRSSERKRVRSPRSMEMSPTRSRTYSFLQELEHKLTLREERNKLREIQEKINDVSVPVNYMPVPVPIPHIPVAPVPPPGPISLPNLHYTQPPQVYDQSFFIGETNFMPIVAAPPSEFPQVTYAKHNYLKTVDPVGSTQMEDAQKLFKDDNISLSNFLAITARVSDVLQPIDIKTKIRVITRCQDAIKIISDTAKPTGRFFYKKPLKMPEKPAELKNQSPMKKVLPVRFHFTTKAKQIEDKYNTPINRLLLKLGLKDPPPITAVVKDTEPPQLIPGRHDPTRANLLMKMTQTDPVKCSECEKRESIKTVEIGVQCGTKSSVDFSCQVIEEDFLNTARSALKNILKNQSFASLTPAQILAQVGQKGEEKKEMFPAARKMGDETTSSPDISVRQGISNNDSFPGPRSLSRNLYGAQGPRFNSYHDGGFGNPNYGRPQQQQQFNYGAPRPPPQYFNPPNRRF